MPADSITLSHLRGALARALTHPENAAIVRLPESERTVEGIARAYLPRYIALEGDVLSLTQRALGWSDLTRAMWLLDLTDPGTTHAVLAALALALGLDPGAGALDVRWCRNGADVAWVIVTDGSPVVFCGAAPDRHYGWSPMVAPHVASEPDPVKALVAALLHTVEALDAR